jgi:lipopolysaccharide export system protein LptA
VLTDSASIKDTVVQLAGSNNKNDSADRFFRAYHHVRIFSDSMQAVCDSLFYSGKDSIFRLFYDPIVWASNSQVTGDTIYMYTKNKQPNELHVFENGLMINKTGAEMYNQIKGNRLFGYFKKGEIDNVRAKGNAESIYYVKDSEEKLIGVNKAQSDIIEMRFINKALNKVVFISAVTGTMFPLKQATEEDKRLRSFKWLDEKRPKTKFELFGN